jgi:hypothetical protein
LRLWRQEKYVRSCHRVGQKRAGAPFGLAISLIALLRRREFGSASRSMGCMGHQDLGLAFAQFLTKLTA